MTLLGVDGIALEERKYPIRGEEGEEGEEVPNRQKKKKKRKYPTGRRNGSAQTGGKRERKYPNRQRKLRKFPNSRKKNQHVSSFRGWPLDLILLIIPDSPGEAAHALLRYRMKWELSIFWHPLEKPSCYYMSQQLMHCNVCRQSARVSWVPRQPMTFIDVKGYCDVFHIPSRELAAVLLLKEAANV